MPPLSLKRLGEIGGEGDWKCKGGKRQEKDKIVGASSSILGKLCRKRLLIFGPFTF